MFSSYGQDSAHLFARGYGVGVLNDSVLQAPGTLSVTIEDGGPAVIKLYSLTGDTPASHVPGRPHGAIAIGYARDGRMEIPVEPGTYNAVVFRGTSYSAFQEHVEIVSNGFC